MLTTTERITKTPDVCGGRACLRGTRITVWGLEAYRRLGMAESQILQAVQGVTHVDLEAAWEYVATHREEIERDIRENEEGDEGFVE